MNKRKCGLKVQSLVALLVSFGVAILVFLILDQISCAILENYLKRVILILLKILGLILAVSVLYAISQVE